MHRKDFKMAKKISKKILKQLFLSLIIISVGYLFSNLNHLDLESLLSETTTLEQVAASSELEQVTLKRVVDGNTIIVLDSNQNEIRVRMIGVDTAESVHVDSSKNTEAGVIANAYTKSQLVQGQTLFLEYDKERLDRYDRTLAYVWLDSNVNPNYLNDIQAKMYNAKLIIEGYEVAKSYPPNTKYETIFKSLE